MSGRYNTPLTANLVALVRDHRQKKGVKVTYSVNLDTREFIQLAEKAYNNRSKKTHIGPVQVVVTEVNL